MATIGSMIVNVLANTTGFASGMAKVRGELGKTQQAANATGLVFSKLGTGLGALGVGFSSAAVISNLRNTAQEIDSLAKTADRLGISTEAFKGLEFGAGLAGISSEQLAGSLQMLTKQIGEAAHGAGKAKVVFAELGVDVQKLAQMTPEQQLGMFADLLANIKDETERTRIAIRLFGGDGAGMLNFLAEGSDAIRGYIQEAKDLGLTFSREEAAKVEAFNDAWERLSKTLGGISKDIVIDIAPAAFEAIEALREALAGLKLGVGTDGAAAAEFMSRKAPGAGEFNVLSRWFNQVIASGTKVKIASDIRSGIASSAPAFTAEELGANAKRFQQFAIGQPNAGELALANEEQFGRNVFAGLNKFLVEPLRKAPNTLSQGLGSLGQFIDKAEDFGAKSQRQWALKQLFPTEGPVDRFFAEKEKEDKRKAIEAGMEANKRMFEGMKKGDKFGGGGGINQAIEAGTVEAFKAMAESRLQRQMLAAAQETNERLAEINRNLTVDITGLN